MTNEMNDTIRVLVADDEIEFATTLSFRLNLRDFQTTVASSGHEALEKIDSEDFDVVILDLKMPDLDGLEVLARLRVNHPKLPVIILTGHGAFEAGREGMELGAFDYIMKPADLNLLTVKIEEAHETVSGSEAKRGR